jgi:hypothetical protein
VQRYGNRQIACRGILCQHKSRSLQDQHPCMQLDCGHLGGVMSWQEVPRTGGPVCCSLLLVFSSGRSGKTQVGPPPRQVHPAQRCSDRMIPAAVYSMLYAPQVHKGKLGWRTTLPYMS